ncbi:MAG: preprotein translocase subunit SecE [Solirubrobacteraceae bacterium]
MARNRQRAKDRKQRRKQSDDDAERLGDDRSIDDPIIDPSLAEGAPPDDLGTRPPPVAFDEEPDDEDVEDEPSGEQRSDEDEGNLAEPPAVKKAGVARIVPFLKACSAELRRVQWPDRRQVGQATAVVLGFVVIAGAFLGLADVIAQRIVDFIL